MKAKLSWALLALCLWSTCQAAPKKNNNKKISDDNSDLIPIPDHLLETYLPSGKFQKTDGNQSVSQMFRMSQKTHWAHNLISFNQVKTF